MNKRIQALVEQATSRPHRDQGIGGEPTHIYPGTFSVEKFAELIVKECCFVGEQWADGLFDLEHYDFVNKRIKEHFGIAE